MKAYANILLGFAFVLMCGSLLGEDAHTMDSFLAWDATAKMAAVSNGTKVARFTFNFTNISDGNVTITAVFPTCECTTVKLPPLPWTIVPGTNGAIEILVNISGTNSEWSKIVKIDSDRGFKLLTTDIIVHPPEESSLSSKQREEDRVIASQDRQAVFKASCAVCHVKPTKNIYGREL